MITINTKIKNLLDDLVNKELETAYLYLDFANYFESLGLRGYAHYYEVGSKQVVDQGLLVYKYLHLNNEKVKLLLIKANDKQFKDIKEVLAYGLEIEQSVTKLIDSIYNLSVELNDYRTMEFIKWFLKTQFKEENDAQNMIDNFEIFTQNKALFNLDSSYSKRDYVKPSMEIFK